MRLKTKQWVQVGVSLSLAIWIFWFLYKDVSAQRLYEALAQTSYTWLLLSLGVAVYSYWLRAWRWKMLIEADGESKAPTGSLFTGLMIGYLTNLIIPRAGEISRCGAVAKTEGIPIGRLLGTVVLERSVDLMIMVFVVITAFLWERNTFIDLFENLIEADALRTKVATYFPIIVAAGLITGLAAFFLFDRYRDNGLVRKLRHFIREFASGFVSLGKVKNQWTFWTSSIGIWLLYYLMMILVSWAIPSTASLAYSSVLMVMVMGSIGMIAPVQGGIGTFHALVAFVLMVYGLEEEQGKIFAVIVHSSQVILTVLLGLGSLMFFLKSYNHKVSKSS